MSDRKVDISAALARAKAIAAKVQQQASGGKQPQPPQQQDQSQDSRRPGLHRPSRSRSPPRAVDRRDSGYDRQPMIKREPPSSMPTFVMQDQEFMYIDANMVGMIIGRGGDTLRSLEHESRTSIRVIQEMLPDGKKKVMITGRPEDIRTARKLIQDRISERDSGGSGGGGHAGRVELRVPHNKLGLIIGKQASTLKDMQAKSGARIWVVQEHQPTDTERIIQLNGTHEAIEKAKQLIDEIVNPIPLTDEQQEGREQQRLSSRVVERFEISCEAAGIVIGRGGECIKAMTQYSGCHLKVDSAPHGQPRTVIIVGETQEIVDKAKQMILDTINNGEFIPGYNASEYNIDWSQYGLLQQATRPDGTVDYDMYYQLAYCSDNVAAEMMAEYQKQQAEYMQQWYQQYAQQQNMFYAQQLSQQMEQ